MRKVKTETLISGETKPKQKEKRKTELKKYLRKLKKDYKDYFLWDFHISMWKYWPNVFDENFLKYFDLESFIKVFHKRMEHFRLDVNFKLDSDSSYGVYLGLVRSILKEVKEGIIVELYGQLYCELESEKFDYKFGRLSKKDYEGNISFWVTQLNHDLFEGIKIENMDGIPTKPFPINSILDNVLAKYEFLFAVGSHREQDALNILSKKLEEEQNKRRTFSLSFMKKIKEIESKEKYSIPKPTQQECVILANKEMKEFDYSALIDEYGKPTELLLSIRNSYKAQKRTL